MMKLSNTDQHYGTVAIALHWLIASLIVALVAMGIYMVRLPDVGFNSTKIILILVHKEIGVLVLALAAARLTWRLLNPLPGLVGTVPEWQRQTVSQEQAAANRLQSRGVVGGMDESGPAGHRETSAPACTPPVSMADRERGTSATRVRCSTTKLTIPQPAR
jgi:hypothetical protein